MRQSRCAGYRGGLRSANTRSGFPPPSSLKARAQRPLTHLLHLPKLLAAFNSAHGHGAIRTAWRIMCTKTHVRAKNEKGDIWFFFGRCDDELWAMTIERREGQGLPPGGWAGRPTGILDGKVKRTSPNSSGERGGGLWFWEESEFNITREIPRDSSLSSGTPSAPSCPRSSR